MMPASRTASEQFYLPTVIGGALFFASLVALMNFVVDPLQIHRRSTYPPIYSENQRHQNAGLVRSHAYSTIVVGNSHVENFSPRQIEALTGASTVKLAVEGGKAAEQQALVSAAIATGRVERVIWGLDHLAFRNSPGSAWGDSGLPRYLYETGARTIGGYWLSLDTLALSRDALLGRGHRDLETLNRWDERAHYGPAEVERSWRRIRHVIAREQALSAIDPVPTSELTRKKVRYFLLPLIRQNPGIRFDFFFAPYSVVAYLADDLVWDREFEERLAFKRSAVEVAAGFENVRVFDFQVARDITHDLSRYKDAHHYDAAVNDWMVRAMESDSYVVDPLAYEDVLDEHARQVEKFQREACGVASRRVYCVR